MSEMLTSSSSTTPPPRYWCHMCDRYVDPITDSEIKCSICHSGFIEEISATNPNSNPNSDFEEPYSSSSSSSNPRSDRAFSLWAPILLGLMGPHPNSRTGTGTGRRQIRVSDGEESQDDELDREFEDFIRRRRRRSAVGQLLQVLREDSETLNPNSRERNNDLERERSSLLINAFNQAILSHSPNPSSTSSNPNSRFPNPSFNSVEEYFVGPGLDLLLQHLSETDPNRYGTPPAKKEVVHNLPKVKIEELGLNCSVCLDEFEPQMEAKMMPCKHKFHDNCILPWLEMHSSCPTCRFQLPVETEEKDNESNNNDENNNNDNINNNNNNNNNNNDDNNSNDGNSNNRMWVNMPWPFNGLFSGRNNNGDSSSGNGGNNGN